ncbi:MAG: deoxyribodipyrimidine photo-lyase [Cytophagales bacterium]|nr:deoxyribodipyrimidine photo-lyase [Cytophagales bacterium]
MRKTKINIVWIKRDIRTQDHAPLEAAETAGLPYLILYVFMPEVMAHPDAALRHHQFCWHALKEQSQRLKPFNREVTICYGSINEVFGYYTDQYEVDQVFSYQESGTEFTWQQDRIAKHIFESKGINWREFQRDGIERGIRDRKCWDKRWFQTMYAPLIQNHYSQNEIGSFDNPFPLTEPLIASFEDYPATFQPAGERHAWQYLKSFVAERGKRYHLDISKPAKSRYSCGRISPYLAWGNLSIKQAYQFIKNHPNQKTNKRAFNGICTRLKWHCHFIQKFEVECTYETICINRGYESLEHNTQDKIIQTWESGKTGYPMVDACMRCVTETGWINFRMRAMLVSFFCHHLDQNWKDGVYHLARQFLDYEPGIHYPQFQMQAGTTGVNTVRIYNPVKQSQDHDPKGEFIKKWIPELSKIPTEHIHEPWKIPPLEAATLGFELGRDYAAPIVNLEKAGKAARAKIWGHRKNSEVRKEKERILQTHTRNNQAKREEARD